MRSTCPARAAMAYERCGAGGRLEPRGSDVRVPPWPPASSSCIRARHALDSGPCRCPLAPVHGGTLFDEGPSELAAPAKQLSLPTASPPAGPELGDPQHVLESVFGYREFRP